MGDIVLTGIGASWALPGNYIQVDLGVGPVGGSQLAYPILLLGNATSAGSATLDTQVYGPTSQTPAQTEQDWINLFGAGSELHRGFLRITDPLLGANNQTTSVYGLAVTASTGTAATATITLVGNATGSGTLRIYMGSEFVDTPINSGDTITTIAANAVLQFNAKTQWAATATSSVGVITITAKIKGPRGNWLRFSTTITSGITTTATGTAIAFFTSGATADSNVAALATIAGSRYFYIVSAAEDATQFGALVSQVTSQALPITGIRQSAFAGYNSTQGSGITISTGINNAYAEYVHLQNSDWTPFEMACHAVANYAALEVKPSPRHNFSGFGNAQADAATWKLPAPRDGTNPTPTALNTGISNGLTSIGVNQNGTTYIVKRCTTRCLNGSNPDFRSRDAHKRTVTFYFADDWQAKLNAQFSGVDFTADPAVGAHVPGINVATPSRIGGALFQLIDDYNSADQLKNVSTIKANAVVQPSPTVPTRAQTRIPLSVIDILDQTCSDIQQVG